MVLFFLGSVPQADAHGFTTVVYADASSHDPKHVVVELGLEYDLMLVSVADTHGDDPLYRAGQPAWDDGDISAMTAALEAHRASVLAYIADGFAVS